MRIALDIDGVLASFQPGWIGPYNEYFDARIDPHDITGWDDFVDKTHFHNEDDFWQWTDTYPNFWANLPVIHGAMHGVYQLLKAKHTLELVTNRHDNTRAQTAEWVRLHWPLGVGPSPTPAHTKKKSEIPCQLYVDDGPASLAELCAVGLPCIKFKQPWNKDAIGNAGAVADWSELVHRITALAEAIA